VSRYEKLLVMLALTVVFVGLAAVTPLITATVQTFLSQIGLH